MPQELPFGRMGTGDPIHDQFRQHRHSTLQPLWEEYLQAHQTDSAMITISGGGAGSMSFSVRITKAGELFADWAEPTDSRLRRSQAEAWADLRCVMRSTRDSLCNEQKIDMMIGVLLFLPRDQE